MSTPSGQKDLWKNIDWKDRDEKTAFFNKYFKDDETTQNLLKLHKERFKKRIIAFIETGEIREKGTKRPINLKDIIEHIKED